MVFKIPKEILSVAETLQKAGFEAYLVGGCTRDLFMDKKPKDWDITTNATPEEIQKLFKNTFYENDYGTVGVVNEGVEDETLKVVEVTPYRIEETYSDKRRPDKVIFAKKLEDDLKRRDFTVNAIAYDPVKHDIFDLFRGEQDLKDKIIRAVGVAEERFDEDALRIMRAIRLATELDFTIETETGDAIKKHAPNLKKIAIERVREEFSKIVMSKNPMRGITLMHQHEILKHIVPELEIGIGCEQNGDHIYDVWEHTLRAAQHSADREWPLHVRLGALFHDIAKPETRRWLEEKKDWTFYGHDVVGGKIARKILERLKYSNEIIDTVTKLVRWHLFFSDIDKITLSAVRRLVRNVGPENVWDLMKVRACDRIGMGRPKEKPYRLRKYESMIEEATRAPVTVGMLKIDGSAIMKLTSEKPGPRIGWILHALLEEVLDDPKYNTKKYLEKKVIELAALTDAKLKKVGEAGKKKREEEEEKEVSEIRKRYFVK
ncbi:MAG: HD domain-containing protein [bacterium]|nr:HD domain-containing protein [bacterium]